MIAYVYNPSTLEVDNRRIVTSQSQPRLHIYYARQCYLLRPCLKKGKPTYKLNVVNFNCNPSTWKEETKKSVVQGYLQIYSQSKANLVYQVQRACICVYIIKLSLDSKTIVSSKSAQATEKNHVSINKLLYSAYLVCMKSRVPIQNHIKQSDGTCLSSQHTPKKQQYQMFKVIFSNII